MYVKICSWLFWALKFISLRSFSHAKFQDLTMGYHMITTYKGWCKAFLMVYKTNGVLLFSRRKIEQPTNHAACCNVFFYNFSTARNLLEKQLPHRYSMNERHDRQKKLQFLSQITIMGQTIIRLLWRCLMGKIIRSFRHTFATNANDLFKNTERIWNNNPTRH